MSTENGFENGKKDFEVVDGFLRLSPNAQEAMGLISGHVDLKDFDPLAVMEYLRERRHEILDRQAEDDDFLTNADRGKALVDAFRYRDDWRLSQRILQTVAPDVMEQADPRDLGI